MNSISSFSGIASGIQWADLVDQIMDLEAARKLSPIQNQVTLQEARRDTWSAYESLLSKLNTAGATIRDQSAFGVLKTAATTSPTDGKNLISASASSSAAPGSYDIEVIRLAKSDKVSGASFTTTDEQLGLSGEFYINGRRIDLETTDSLTAIRNKVNAVNTGSNASGVSATILTTSANEHRLVFTSTSTGNRGIELVDGDSDALESLGVVSSSTTSNTKAGDSSVAQSQRVKSTTTKLASMLGVSAPPAVTTILVDGQKVTVDLENDTLLSLFNKVQTAGASATLDEETVGGKTFNRLSITGSVTADGTASDTAASQRIVELLGFEKKSYASAITTGQDATLRIDGFNLTRRTNTVSDAIEGVTIDLLAANGNQRTSSISGAGLSIATNPQTIAAGSYEIGMTHTELRSTSTSDPSLAVLSAPGTASAGTYDVNITTAASVASTTGSGFDGTYYKFLGSDTLTITDGSGNAGAVTLNNGKALATIISELNGSFSSSGATLEASDVGGQLSITSTTAVGSASTFTVSSTNANVESELGIADGVYNGTDVAGTIGGIAATGSGDVLTGGSGAVNGLQVQYTGSATGSPVGTVTVTDTPTVTGVTINGEAAVWNSATSTISGADGSDFEGLKIGYAGAYTTGTLGSLTVEGDIGVTLNVTRDLDAPVKTMQEFASAYNAVLNFYNNQRANTNAPLYANGSLRAMQRAVTESIIKQVDGLSATSNYTRGTLAGVSLTRNGLLEVDAEVFKGAMQTNLSEIKALFGTAGSASNSLVSFSSGSTATTPGTYAVDITAPATTATHLGSVWGGTYTASNGVSDTLTITDGYTSNSVDFVATEGMTLSEAVTELTALFENNSLRLSAVVDGGALRITAKEYGTAAAFTLAGNEAATRLGLTESTYTGTNVTGTIGGLAATGSGRTLTGAAGGATEGLAIRYTGAATGGTGTVSYALGIMGNLNRAVDPFIRTGDGTISLHLDSIDTSISTLNSRAADAEARLETRRVTLEAQYLRMESAIGALNSQGEWLSSQISGLAGFSSSDN